MGMYEFGYSRTRNNVYIHTLTYIEVIKESGGKTEHRGKEREEERKKKKGAVNARSFLLFFSPVHVAYP